jgi:hypothetical protein
MFTQNLTKIYGMQLLVTSHLWSVREFGLTSSTNAALTQTATEHKICVLPACPSDKSSNKMKMSMDHWWNGNDGRKQKYWEKKLSQWN